MHQKKACVCHGMRNVTVAATQMSCTYVSTVWLNVSPVWEENVAKGEKLVREAAAKGAQVILLQELFSGWYFCQDEKQESFALAEPASSSRLIAHFQKIAKELGVVLPISFFEKDNQAYYNSIAIIDADLFWVSTESLIFLMDLVMKKSSTSILEIQVSKCGTQSTVS